MIRYGVSVAFAEIFFTHFHADHFLGVIGLIRTLGLQGHDNPLRLYGPKGAKKVLRAAISLGVERVPFPIEIEEAKPGAVVAATHHTPPTDYEIRVAATEHRGRSVGSAVREH